MSYDGQRHSVSRVFTWVFSSVMVLAVIMLWTVGRFYKQLGPNSKRAGREARSAVLATARTNARRLEQASADGTLTDAEISRIIVGGLRRVTRSDGRLSVVFATAANVAAPFGGRGAEACFEESATLPLSKSTRFTITEIPIASCPPAPRRTTPRTAPQSSHS